MTISDMHYDFKFKINKVDSEKYRNLKVPEIDWALNEAQNIFVDIIAEPRVLTYLGFEKSQKNIDDIRVLVSTEEYNNMGFGSGSRVLLPLPNNYRYYVNKLRLTLKKGVCTTETDKVTVVQHSDNVQSNTFYNSSFEWGKVNIMFEGSNVVVLTDGTFEVSNAKLTYVRNIKPIYNAAAFGNGSYKTVSGVVLTGTSDCELPAQTHGEIVDLAVAITAGNIEMRNYRHYLEKLRFNYLK